MKKYVAFLLAVSLLASMGAAAFAADNGAGSMQEVSSGSIPVSGTYTTEAAPGELYYVDVSWTGLSFTYHAETKGAWDPDTFTYSEDGGEPAYWTSSDGDKYGTITLTNKSATGGDNSVQVTLTFVSSFMYGTVSMKFSTVAESVSSGAIGTAAVTLPTYSGSSPEPVNVYVTPTTQGAISSFDGSQTLGTINLTIRHLDSGGWSDPGIPEGPGIDSVSPAPEAGEIAANG